MLHSDKHLAKSSDVHSSIHPLIHSSSIILCFLRVFPPTICPKYSVISFYWLFYTVLPLKTAELWMTLELLDIDYKHLKWKAIMSISIWHKGFTADHRVIWINMLCHWQGMVQWWKRASFQIQFYKADNTKLLSLCLTGRVMRYKLNFSPGDETQWAGIWGKR